MVNILQLKNCIKAKLETQKKQSESMKEFSLCAPQH